MSSSNYKILGFVFSIMLFFGSCKTAMLYTTLDVLRPAQVEFSPDVEKILIVNNSTIQPANFGHTTRSLGGQLQTLEIETDSAALFTLSVLAEEIENTDFFNSVDLLLNSINNNSDFTSITPLQKTSLRELYKIYDVDAILSLDHMVVKDEIREYYNSEWNEYLALLAVRYETLWSIHHPQKIGVTAVHFKDSLFWESESYNRAQMQGGLPDRQDAIIDGALFVGQNSAKRFIPHWEKSDRYFYDSANKLMKQGMDSVYVKNWEAALSLWNQVFNSTNNIKLKAQAANNIAIVSEITGDYDKALEFAKISFDLSSTKVLTDDTSLARLSSYIVELFRRKREIEILNKQLGRE